MLVDSHKKEILDWLQITRLRNTTEAANPKILLPIKALAWFNCTGRCAGKIPAMTGRIVLNSRGPARLLNPGPAAGIFLAPVAGSRRIVRPNNLSLDARTKRRVKYWVLSAPSMAAAQSFEFSYSIKAYPLHLPRKSFGMKTDFRMLQITLDDRNCRDVLSFTVPHCSNLSSRSASVHW